MGYIRIGVDVLRDGGGDDPKLEESESMLDKELSMELLPLNQHLFFFISYILFILNLWRNLATWKVNSGSYLSDCGSIVVSDSTTASLVLTF